MQNQQTFRFVHPIPGTALGYSIFLDGVPIGWARKNTDGRWTSYDLDGRRVYSWNRTRRAAAEHLASNHTRAADPYAPPAPSNGHYARQAEIASLEARRADIDARLAEIDAQQGRSA